MIYLVETVIDSYLDILWFKLFELWRKHFDLTTERNMRGPTRT